MRWLKIVGVLVFFQMVLQAETLSLEDCVQLAMQNNPDLQKSGYSLKSSAINVKDAWSALYPGVSANASTSTSGPVASEYNSEWGWSMGGGISQTFYSPGMYSNIALAKSQQKATELSNLSLKDQVRASVENLYYSILTSDTLIGVYRANIHLAEEEIRKMRQMVDLGMKRQSDLLKSEVQRGTFEAQLVQEEKTLYASKRSLNVLMGRRPDVPFSLEPIPVETLALPDYETARAMMIERNPDLRNLKKQIDIQKLSLRIAKEAYLPSITGSYSYSRSGETYGGETTEGDQIGLRLSLTLFDGFSRSQNVQKGKIGLDEAQLDFDTALREQDQALSNQYQALDTQNRLIQIHETNLVSARKDKEVVSRQYAEGFSSVLDLMDAQVSVLESETNLLKDLYARKEIESEILRLIADREK